MQLETHEVPAISNTFMFLKRTDFDRLAGFDDGFFLFGAGLDFCRRVHRADGKVVCVPRVRVTHMPRGAAFSPATEWQQARGLMRYLGKHGKGEYFPGVVPLARAAVLLRFGVKVVIGVVRGWVRHVAIMGHGAPAKRLMVLALGLAELSQEPLGALDGRTVLVTGATSQVGLCVVQRLLAAGASVLAISRNDPIPFAHENLRWIKGDLSDGKLYLQGYLVDVAVHCAPLMHLPPTLKLLADAEVRRVIAFGSTSIFTQALSPNANEKELAETLAKAEAEIAEGCATHGIEWTILRPTLTYGVGLDVNVSSLAKSIRRFRFFPVYPPALGRRQPVHADEQGVAAKLAMEKATTFGKAYNLSGGEINTYQQMLERLFDLYDLGPHIVNVSMLPSLFDLAGVLLRKRHINGAMARRMNDDLVFFHDEAKKISASRQRGIS